MTLDPYAPAAARPRFAFAARLAFVALAALAALAVGSCRKASSPQAPSRCVADDECIISCETAGDCCRDPYCEQTRHRDDAKAALEQNQSNCKKADYDLCPQVGSRNEAMIDYAVVPHCRAGACVVEKVKRAPPPGSSR